MLRGRRGLLSSMGREEMGGDCRDAEGGLDRGNGDKGCRDGVW